MTITFIKNGELMALQEHQQEVVNHFQTHFALYAYHDTGTGKTLSAMAAMCAVLEADPDAYGVIACPAGVVDQWEEYRIFLQEKKLSARISIVSHNYLADRIKEQWEINEINPNQIVTEVHDKTTKTWQKTIFQVGKKANNTMKLPFIAQKTFEDNAMKLLKDWKTKDKKGKDYLIDYTQKNLFVVVDEAQENFKNLCTFESNHKMENPFSWALRFLAAYVCHKLLLLSATPIVNGYEDLITPVECLKLVELRGTNHLLQVPKYMRFEQFNAVHKHATGRRLQRDNKKSGFTDPVFGFSLTKELLKTRIDNTVANIHPQLDFMQNLLHYTQRHKSNPCYPKLTVHPPIKRDVIPNQYYTWYRRYVERKLLKTQRFSAPSGSPDTSNKDNIASFYAGELLNQLCIYEYTSKWTYPYTKWESPVIEECRYDINPERAHAATEQNPLLRLSTGTKTSDGSCYLPDLIYSPLYDCLLELLRKQISKTVIFTQKKETQYYCYYSLQRDLDNYNIRVLHKPPFQPIVYEYNANMTAISKRGEVLFITRSGSKGVDLEGTDNIIFLEMPFSYMEERQIIGRGQRFNSHIKLPRHHQKVNIYKFFLTFPNNPLWECGNTMIDSIVQEKKIMETNFITAVKKYSDIMMQNQKYYQQQIDRLIRQNVITSNQRDRHQNDCAVLKLQDVKRAFIQPRGLSGFTRNFR